MPKSKVDRIDIQIGSRLKLRRAFLGITQQDLASLLKISFQQVQKYEKGVNRLGPKRLLEMSSALNVPINYFFQDIEIYRDSEERGNTYYGLAEEKDSLNSTVEEGEINKLTSHFRSIAQLAIRQQILNLVVTLSEIENKPDDNERSFTSIVPNGKSSS